MSTLFAAGIGDYHDLIFWGAILLICIVPSISYYLYKWRKTELEADLKHDMIARGMSAEEIERVLSARMSPPGDESSKTRREIKETQDYRGK
jgi:hypothetical protein